MFFSKIKFSICNTPNLSEIICIRLFSVTSSSNFPPYSVAVLTTISSSLTFITSSKIILESFVPPIIPFFTNNIKNCSLFYAFHISIVKNCLILKITIYHFLIIPHYLFFIAIYFINFNLLLKINKLFFHIKKIKNHNYFYLHHLIFK